MTWQEFLSIFQLPAIILVGVGIGYYIRRAEEWNKTRCIDSECDNERRFGDYCILHVPVKRGFCMERSGQVYDDECSIEEHGSNSLEGQGISRPEQARPSFYYCQQPEDTEEEHRTANRFEDFSE